jgi:DeoR/GlpR family transcriptional regulator of sugar metabolism
MNESGVDKIIPAERQKRIIELLKQNGAVKAADLSDIFDVTALTIRRDLDLLEKKGVLERSHGGAVLRQTMRKEPSYLQKDNLLTEEKRKLARAAVSLIEDGDTVFVNSGSTNKQVLELLAEKKVRIITNNTWAIEILRNTDIELHILGGVYRTQARSLAGSFTADALRKVFANKAIIGVDGVSLKHGLTTPAEPEAEVARLMIEQTSCDVIIAADHSKIGVVSNFLISTLDKVSYIVTDSKAEGILDVEEIEKNGTKVIFSKDN